MDIGIYTYVGIYKLCSEHQARTCYLIIILSDSIKTLENGNN